MLAVKGPVDPVHGVSYHSPTTVLSMPFVDRPMPLIRFMVGPTLGPYHMPQMQSNAVNLLLFKGVTILYSHQQSSLPQRLNNEVHSMYSCNRRHLKKPTRTYTYA